MKLLSFTAVLEFCIDKKGFCVGEVFNIDEKDSNINIPKKKTNKIDLNFN
jgi:hypothetical protein